MAQGAIKKGASVPKSNTQRKQTGARIIKPKKPALIKQQKMKKVPQGVHANTVWPLADWNAEALLRVVGHDRAHTCRTSWTSRNAKGRQERAQCREGCCCWQAGEKGQVKHRYARTLLGRGGYLPHWKTFERNARAKWLFFKQSFETKYTADTEAGQALKVDTTLVPGCDDTAVRGGVAYRAR